MTVTFELDEDVNALYVRVKTGTVAKTLKISDSVFLDVDRQNRTIGIEFVDADEFLPFIKQHHGRLGIPARFEISTDELFSAAD
jgi:uncharacterized protein YuzE